MYAHSNELDEVGVVSLTGVNVECDPQKEMLLGVCILDTCRTLCALLNLLQKPFSFTLFTSSNSHALAAPNLKEQQTWVTKLDPTRLMS